MGEAMAGSVAKLHNTYTAQHRTSTIPHAMKNDRTNAKVRSSYQRFATE